MSLYRQCVRTVPAYMADETARSFFKLSLLKEMTVRHQATAVKDDDGGSDGTVNPGIIYDTLLPSRWPVPSRGETLLVRDVLLTCEVR